MMLTLIFTSCAYVNLNPCDVCVDADSNGICDKCKKEIEIKQCESCVNEDGNDSCDVASTRCPFVRPAPTPTVTRGVTSAEERLCTYTHLTSPSRRISLMRLVRSTDIIPR